MKGAQLAAKHPLTWSPLMLIVDPARFVAVAWVNLALGISRVAASFSLLVSCVGDAA
jgi:hypothetical protein